MADERTDKVDISLKPSSQGGLGLRLRAAREARGLDREQIAARLRLSMQWITDMENDDYRRAPALVYVRGNVRAYAKLLGLPEIAVIEELEQMDLEDKAVLRQAPAVFKQVPNRRYSIILWITGSVVLAAGLISIITATFHHHQVIKTVATSTSLEQPQSQNGNVVPIAATPLSSSDAASPVAASNMPSSSYDDDQASDNSVPAKAKLKRARAVTDTINN